jgi:beta-galactosidase
MLWVATTAASAEANTPSAAASAAEPTPRLTVPLTAGWRFNQVSGLEGAQAAQFDDSGWTQVSVPHTWNRIGNKGSERSPESNDVQGVGWYRLRFTAPPAPQGSRYFLQFDAVGTIADVWLNGHYLGRHEGAFARFRFDATTAIQPAGDNLLVVKADNTRPAPGASTENVSPLSGDFFMFGGLYRKVALLVTPSVHLDLLDFGGPGVYWRTTQIAGEQAAVEVNSRVANNDSSPRRVNVTTDILDRDGRLVAATSQLSAPIAPGAVFVAHAELSFATPRLWQGVRDPYLYHIVVSLKSAPPGAVLDRVIQPLGLRTFKFDADKGFFLNGQHQYLKGVALHQDRVEKGWAVTDADQEEDFAILADLGANAVRLAHYQHDQRSYEVADERGIVVWAEIPLVNKVSFDGSPANAALAANARQQLLELIQQNRNHPAVALWSIANEIDLTATQQHGSSKPAALLRSLKQIATTQDPDRPTTLADCCEPAAVPNPNERPAHDAGDKTARDAIVGLTDTVGYNRYFGWYYGHFSDLGPMLDEAHARHPQLPISVSEYGAGAALTQHTDDPTGGPINSHGRPHPEEFQSLYHETAWESLRQRPYLWGSFIWNLIDFASDSRQEGDLTDVNDKGLVTYDRRTRKDAFYFYRANWSTEPTLHLTGRRYVDRPYAVVDVKAYSNAARAKLTLNGADAGVTECSGGICLWHAVHLRPGSNELRATAEVRGTTLSDSMQWTYAGDPAVVRIKCGDMSGYVSADGRRYGSDMYFAGGEATGTVRQGEFSYRVPVPDGRYAITLEFEEPTAGAGERIFDVGVNGKVALKHFDIFNAAGGRLKAVQRTLQATAREGVLLLDFKPVKGQAIVSGLSIAPTSR